MVTTQNENPFPVACYSVAYTQASQDDVLVWPPPWIRASLWLALTKRMDRKFQALDPACVLLEALSCEAGARPSCRGYWTARSWGHGEVPCGGRVPEFATQRTKGPSWHEIQGPRTVTLVAPLRPVASRPSFLAELQTSGKKQLSEVSQSHGRHTDSHTVATIDAQNSENNKLFKT